MITENRTIILITLLFSVNVYSMDQQVSASSSSTEDTDIQSKLLNKQLIEATKKGDVSEMTLLLDKGADIDAQKITGLTPLAHAAYYGHAACVKLLLERGAQWEVKFPVPVFPDHKIALLEEHHECAKLFWEAGSDQSKEVEFVGAGFGETQLQRAILFCDQNRIGSLREDVGYTKKIIQKTNSNAHNWLLGCAALAGSVPLMRLLIDQGADPHCTFFYGSTVLSLASLGGCRECVQICLDNGVSVDDSADRDQDHLQGYWPLCGAIVSKSLDIFKLLLSRGASVSIYPKKDHFSVLFLAAATGNYEMAMELIERGADIWERGGGLTLLHAAAKGGSLRFFEYLLKSGLSLEQKADDGSTVLHRAASGSLDIVKLLLKKNLDVNAQNDYGYTPLHYAAMEGNLSMVKELVDSGADIHLKAESGETLLDCAVASGSTECVSYCLDLNMPINSVDYYGRTSLYRAIERGLPDCARLLIARGADININPRNRPPLQLLAAQNRQIDTMFQLIEKGADPLVRDSVGTTLLHCAARYGSVPAVELCLEGGIDVNVQMVDGNLEFPLHCAVRSGNLDVVKLLLDAGARIDAQMRDSETPLMVAVQEKQVAIFDELLARGANCDSKVMSCAVKSLPYFVKACIDHDTEGILRANTFIHVAVAKGSPEVVRLLLAKGAEVDFIDTVDRTPLMRAAERGSVEIMRILLENGAFIGAMDVESLRSVIHYAASSGSLECVKLCVEAGLAHECEDKYKNRPSHCAARSGALDVIRYLVEEKNASVNCTTHFGSTPLHILAEHQNLEGVEYLLSKGAKREVKNSRGWTPLTHALGGGAGQKNSVAKALLDAGVVSVGLNKILKEMIRNKRTETDLYELLVPYCYRLFNPSSYELWDSMREINKAFKYFMWIRYGESKDIDRVEHPTLHGLGLDNQLWILTADPDLSDSLACVLLSELNSDKSSFRPTICDWFTPKNRAVVLAADASREAVVNYLLRKLKAALGEVIIKLKDESSQQSARNDELARVIAIVQSDVEDERLRICIRDGINRRFRDLAGKPIVSNDDSEACSSQTIKKQEESTGGK